MIPHEWLRPALLFVRRVDTVQSRKKGSPRVDGISLDHSPTVNSNRDGVAGHRSAQRGFGGVALPEKASSLITSQSASQSFDVESSAGSPPNCKRHLYSLPYTRTLLERHIERRIYCRHDAFFAVNFQAVIIVNKCMLLGIPLNGSNSTRVVL